jgi:dienelactone hydrolase
MWGKIAIVAVALATAGSAAAQDCLTGATTLEDQRAIAALRADTEANCPCASFGGPRGRRDYRRCARDETNAAITGGTLRRQCLGTARRLYKGATCGTNRVACGGIKQSSGQPRCRLAAPSGRNQCDGSPSVSETACSEQTHCADVIEWTAGTCVDPRQRGPYNVGARQVLFTKDSANMPGTPRELDTIVWYPTTDAATPIDNYYDAVLDAPINAAGAPYPMLMFSHGSCGYPAQSTFLAPLIASYGYVVVAPPHPGNTVFEFPNCAANLGPALVERPQDIIFVTDEMLAANADNGSPFFGLIDPDRLGMSGHSFGGLTTYLVQAQDPRFIMAMPLAPAALGNSQLTVPSLSMIGEIDGRVNNDAVRDAYESSSAPKIIVEIERAGHYAFSDGCFPGPDCSPPTTTTQAESHAAVLRWALPFVQYYLGGDISYEPFFNSVPPGVVVQQDR